MSQLRTEGLTDVESVAVATYKFLTGRSHEDYMDEYADLLFRERV